MKHNETLGKWCKNKHGASKIIDTLETYQCVNRAEERKRKTMSISSDGWVLHVGDTMNR
jgi:hypothetical protein